MAHQTTLTPNPFITGSIARVVVINTDKAMPLVVHVDPLYQQPLLLKPLNPGYTFAIRFWKAIVVAVFLGGIALSFIWYWWTFMLDGLPAFGIQRHNRRSVADFVVESVIEQKELALAHFRSLNLMWVPKPANLVRDST